MIKQIFNYIKKHEVILLVIILAFGLLARFYLINEIEEPIDRDAKLYYEIAQDILSGNGLKMALVNDRVPVPPGYPVFLAMVLFFNSDVNTVYYTQALLNILSVLLVWLSLKKFKIDKNIRLLIAGLFTLSTSFIFINLLYATTLSIFLMALFLFISTADYFDTKQFFKNFLLGFILILLVYTRPTFYLLPLFLLFSFILIKIGCKNVKISKYHFLIIFTMVILYLPWMMYSQNILNTQAMANRGSGSIWSPNAEIPYRTVWHSVTDISKYEADRTAKDTIYPNLIESYKKEYNIETEEELNNFLKKKGILNIIQHPIRFSILSLNRFLIFWFSPPVGSNTLKNIHSAVFWVILILKYCLTLCAIAGLLLMAKNKLEYFMIILLVVIYLTLLHSLLHAIQRYFLPLLPITYFSLGYFFQSILNKTKI